MRRSTLLVLLLAPGAAHAAGTRHVVADGSKASFRTEAPLETVTGVTGKVTGAITLEDGAPKPGARVEVDLASLRTGIDVRDGHLRGEEWLDVENHPKAVFVLTTASKLSDTWELAGRFTARGVTRDVRATARVSDASGGRQRVSATFRTRFTDHGMKIPSLLAYRLSDEIQITVLLLLEPAPK